MTARPGSGPPDALHQHDGEDQHAEAQEVHVALVAQVEPLPQQRADHVGRQDLGEVGGVEEEVVGRDGEGHGGDGEVHAASPASAGSPSTTATAAPATPAPTRERNRSVLVCMIRLPAATAPTPTSACLPQTDGAAPAAQHHEGEGAEAEDDADAHLIEVGRLQQGREDEHQCGQCMAPPMIRGAHLGQRAQHGRHGPGGALGRPR